jgi:hypothetical protein
LIVSTVTAENILNVPSDTIRIKKGGFMNKVDKISILLCCCILFCLSSSFSQTGSNYVDSKLYEFINDGSWCWFQDERAVVDTKNDKLIIGTANMNSGVDLIIFDIMNKRVESTKRFGGLAYSDDHNSPGVLVMPNVSAQPTGVQFFDGYKGV